MLVRERVRAVATPIIYSSRKCRVTCGDKVGSGHLGLGDEGHHGAQESFVHRGDGFTGVEVKTHQTVHSVCRLL